MKKCNLLSSQWLTLASHVVMVSHVGGLTYLTNFGGSAGKARVDATLVAVTRRNALSCMVDRGGGDQRGDVDASVTSRQLLRCEMSK